jgi:hypothetical protein
VGFQDTTPVPLLDTAIELRYRFFYALLYGERSQTDEPLEVLGAEFFDEPVVMGPKGRQSHLSIGARFEPDAGVQYDGVHAICVLVFEELHRVPVPGTKLRFGRSLVRVVFEILPCHLAQAAHG